MKKRDFLILLAVFLIAGAAFLVRSLSNSGKAALVVIKQNNKQIYSDSLFKNKIITLNGNTVNIKDGIVYMADADCKNQICVNHKPISKKGENIICLPNKVIIEIK